MVPYAGLSFYCFELAKYLCVLKVPDYTCNKIEIADGKSSLELMVYAKLICGGMSGAVAQSFSYPMDVARRRMQLAMMHTETEKFA